MLRLLVSSRGRWRTEEWEPLLATGDSRLRTALPPGGAGARPGIVLTVPGQRASTFAAVSWRRTGGVRACQVGGVRPPDLAQSLAIKTGVMPRELLSCNLGKKTDLPL